MALSKASDTLRSGATCSAGGKVGVQQASAAVRGTLGALFQGQSVNLGCSLAVAAICGLVVRLALRACSLCKASRACSVEGEPLTDTAAGITALRLGLRSSFHKSLDTSCDACGVS